MRRSALSFVLLFLASLASATPARKAAAQHKEPAPRHKQASRAKPGPTAQTPAIPLPGVAAAAPKKKPAANGANVARPLLAPWLPGNVPAGIVGPGQTPALPGLPGLPGPGGLLARPVNPVSPLIYGVSAPWGDNGTLANWAKDGGARARRLAQLIKGAGATNVRVHLRWADIEPRQGRYDWDRADHFVRFVSGLGLTLVCLVDDAPAWTGATTADGGLPAPGYYSDLGGFAAALASRYRGRISRWEFWNEPDRIGSAPSAVPSAAATAIAARRYSDMLRVFTAAVRRGNPNAQVAVGGLGVESTDFLAALYRAGARPWFDAVALHPYSERDVIAFSWIDACHAVTVKNGDAAKSLWLTEWGWQTAPARPEGVSELHQARLIRQSLAGMRQRPWIAVADYRGIADWRGRESDPATLVASGLSTYNLMPKPGYQAFREMATGVNPEAASRYARVGLTGGLPLAEEAGVRGLASNVTVEAGKPGAPLAGARLWSGFSQGYEPRVPKLAAELTPRLKQLDARLVRFDPFPDPGSVRMADSGAPGPRPASLAAAPPAVAPSRIDWSYADAMVDAVTRGGARPMLDFATMPSALSAPAGNPRLPRSLAEWSSFVEAVVRRYNGEQKRGIVYWELSSEPNRGDFTLSEWLPFYAAFARAVASADPNAKVGGPATAGCDEAWLTGLADYCARTGTPLNFLSWHAYGQPAAEYGRQVAAVRAALQRQPALRDVELMVDEWNPAGTSTPAGDLADAARAASTVEQLADAGATRALYYEVREGPALRGGVSAGWGLLTASDRPKATYNLFRLLNHLDGRRLPTASDDTDIHALAARDGDTVAVLLWSDPTEDTRQETRDTRQRSSHGPSSLIPHPSSLDDVPVHLRLRGLPGGGVWRGEIWTVDALHGNVAGDAATAELATAARFEAAGNDVEIPVVMSPRSVTLVELTPRPAGAPPKLGLTLETPRYVVYGGSPFVLTAVVRNRTAAPQTATLTLGGRDLPDARRVSRRLSLAPGEAKIVPFSLAAPLGRAEGQRFYEATAAPVGANSDEAKAVASVAVKFADPLAARLTRPRVDVPRPGALPDSAFSLARVGVVLENRSDATLRVGVLSGRTAKDVTLPRHQAATVPVVVAPDSNQPGVYAQTVKVLEGESAFRPLRVLVGVPGLAVQAARPVRANGDLDEWAAAAPISLEAVDAGTRPLDTNYGAQVSAMWDAQRLYLAVTVTDTEDGAPPQATTTEWLPQVQLGVGAPPGDGSDPRAASFVLDYGRWGARVYQGYSGMTPKGIVEGAEVGVRQAGSRTIYEIAIPWKAVPGGRPAPGGLAAFSARVNDARGLGRPALDLPRGDAGGSAPDAWFSLRLARP